MNTSINVKKVGFAVGFTFSWLYVGCMLIMATVGHDGTVKFFNSMLHGLDISPIVRMNISFGEALIGVVELFILGWLIGASTAAFYKMIAK